MMSPTNTTIDHGDDNVGSSIRSILFLINKTTKEKEKQLKEMRENLDVGDKVTTIGGIIAHVAKVKENCCSIRNRSKQN